MVQIFENLFIFVDGFFYLFCVYYLLLYFINLKGEVIGVIYGVVNMFKSLIK